MTRRIHGELTGPMIGDVLHADRVERAAHQLLDGALQVVSHALVGGVQRGCLVCKAEHTAPPV